MKRRAWHRGDEGIALLVVLLTITLLTIVVVEFTESAQVETHFALSERNGLQAYYLARSGVNVGEALLAQDWKLSKGHDSDDDIWARPLPPLPVGEGTVALRVRDEGRHLNLNQMLSGGFVPPDRRRPFERLFAVLGIDQRVLAAIVDWLDADGDPTADPPGAEQPYYLGMTPPVVVRNGPMLTMRELLQIRGMTPTLFARLEEFVTVLPVGRDPFRVNVNTASAEVLYALSDGLMADPGVVDRLIAARREHAFTDKVELDDVSGWKEALSKGNGLADIVDTKSTYFRIDAVGEVNDVARGIVTLVRREDGRHITRVTWAPSTVNLSLTSQPPSDFLDSLPPIGGN